MFSGFYTAGSGMLINERKLNVLTNNFSNQNTPGYQAERLATTTFEYEYAIRKDANGITKLGGSTPIVLVRDVPVSIESGMIEETGRTLDLALEGAGFFNVQAENEQVYLTRNGKFDLDEEGYLILKGGGKVLGQNGPILLGTSNFSVDSEGFVRDANGLEIDQLKITWPDRKNLQKYTNGLYIATTIGTARNDGIAGEGETADTAGTPFTIADAAQNNMANDPAVNIPLEQPSVVQMALESSNVDPNQEYTMVMEAQRAFQACSTVIKAIDQINQRAASSIAKV